MTNQELDCKLKSLAAQERTLTKEVLWHIAEVDKRKLFLLFAYPSLFAYLTQHIGYSEGAAQRRIDAARLIKKVPEVSAAIEEGTINLAQVSKVQKICRQIKRDSGQVIQVELQKSVLKKLENKNAAQTDLILAQAFDVKIQTHASKKIQKDESVRLELTFSKEEMELLDQARALLSNKVGGELKSSIVEMAKRIIKDSTPKEKSIKAVNHDARTISAATVAVNSNPKIKSTILDANRDVPILGPMTLKTVTPRLKRVILKRDQFCQFKDPKTGRMCGSRFFLEVDHIQPRFLKGPNTQENLRLLCKSHNLFRYEKGV